MVLIKIESDMIVEIQFGRTKMLPKKELKVVEHYPELRKHIRYFEENFYIEGEKQIGDNIESWDENELKKFISENTTVQNMFLEALIAKADKTYIEEIIHYFESKGKSLKPRGFAGITSGFTKRLRKKYGLKEPFWETDYDNNGKYYKIKNKYTDIIKKILHQLKEDGK